MNISDDHVQLKYMWVIVKIAATYFNVDGDNNDDLIWFYVYV